MHRLKLYIVGETRKSIKLMNDLRVILETEIEEPYSLDVIDVLDHPQKAIDDEIFVTPTLVKVHPPPVRKIIGDLTDRGMVLKKYKSSIKSK